MLSPWIIHTLTLPPLLASLVPCNFRRCIKPTIYLPQNSHHTYLLWNFHSHFEIYCHATSTVPFYYDTHHHCHIVLICMRHLSGYRNRGACFPLTCAQTTCNRHGKTPT